MSNAPLAGRHDRTGETPMLPEVPSVLHFHEQQAGRDHF